MTELLPEFSSSAYLPDTQLSRPKRIPLLREDHTTTPAAKSCGGLLVNLHFTAQAPQGDATLLHQCPAPAYLITSSACIRSVGGNVIPRAFAVLRLSTSSNLMGCSTGRSAGLAPFRILST